MLKSRKGLGIKFMMSLVIALIGGGIVISAFTGGPLYQTIIEGKNQNKDVLDSYSGTIEVKDKETLSAAAHYVYDRALSCNQIDDEYPGLAETIYTASPDCTGKEAGALRGDVNPASSPGNDMEGKFGRINFEVKEPITLETGGTTWLEQPSSSNNAANRILAVSERGLSETLVQECSVLEKKESSASNAYLGTNDKYIIYFEADIRDRLKSGRLVKDVPNLPFPRQYSMKTKLCVGQPVSATGDLLQADLERENEGQSYEVRVCPGDEGFISTRVGSPFKQGEAGEDFFGSSFKFPMIQVTKTSETSC